MASDCLASKLRPGDTVTDPNGKVVQVTEVSVTKVNYMGRLVFGTLITGRDGTEETNESPGNYSRVAVAGEIWTKE